MEWHGFSEIDKYATAVYKKHYPKAVELGDIKAIKSYQIPENLDLVTFGFPCQDLSVAGKRKGITASRSGLFIKAMRIIRLKKPKYFIFENVLGLFSSDEGEAFSYILRTVTKAGYDCQWQVLDTRWFLPQNRERIYFIGHFREKSRPKIFPFGETGEGIINERIEKQSDIEVIEDFYPDRVRIYKNESPTLRSDRSGLKIREATKTGYSIAKEGDSIDLSFPDSETRRGRVGKSTAQTLDTGCNQGVVIPIIDIDYKTKKQNGRLIKTNGEPAFTVTARDTNGIITNQGIRYFTLTELERLQGFPDNWTKKGIYNNKEIKISDNQRKIMVGNAVSIPVVKAV